MKNSKFFFLLALGSWLLAQSNSLHAQVPPDSSGINQDAIENTLEQTDASDANLESTTDRLEQLKRHPINLNKADDEDLQTLVDAGLISQEQKSSFQLYIKHFGALITIYELQAIPSFDLNTIYALLPYISVDKQLGDYHASFKKILTDGNYMLLVRAQQVLQTSVGFSPEDSTGSSRYLGSPVKLYTRFRYNFGNRLSYGITAEKDAGEEFFKGTQPHGFDFYSAHFYMKTNSFLQAFAIGDYEIHFGQGLICWSGFGSGKNALITDVSKGGYALKPYTSVNEYNFFRGGAFVLGNKNFNLTVFSSYKKVDGNIIVLDTISEDAAVVSSIGTGGYHRTLNEIADKNSMTKTDAGACLSFYKQNLHVGLNGMFTQFSADITPRLYAYNQFTAPGNNLTSVSLDYSYQKGNAGFFGEVARSDNGGLATVDGVVMSLDPKVDVTFVYRNYEKNYQSFYASSFGESSIPNNENGLYAGIVIKPIRRWTFNAYADYYNKPWLDYLVSAPSHGEDYLMQLTYTPNKVVAIYGRFHHEIKQKNFTGNTTVFDYLTDTRKDNFRLHLSVNASSSLKFSSRAEWVKFEMVGNKIENGYIVYQDVTYKTKGVPLSLTLRYALFDTDGYDSRIYTYENDVLYQFSVPALQNRGSRFYVVAHYAISRALDCWLRYDVTLYDNLTTISSGLDQINGSKKSELKVEVRYRF